MSHGASLYVNWAGGPAKIASRAVDSTGYVQPTVADIAKSRALAEFVHTTTASSPGRSVKMGR